VLEHADRLRERLERYLASESVLTYLREEHGLEASEIDDWLARVRADRGHGTVRARAAPHPGADFVERASEIRRTPVFADLPADEVERIGERLLRKEHGRGTASSAPATLPTASTSSSTGRSPS
jgi:hypothetical protein